MLVLAACSGRSSGQQSANPPFVSTPIADFDSPWALAFLPGTSRALVTEKRGRIWLVDIATGAKQEISGVPKVRAGGQGGLLDIALSPRFASDRLVYLSYSEPSPESGSGLALARARLSGTGLNGLQLIWRDPQGGSGGQFGGIIAFAPDGNSLFLSTGDRQRFTPAQNAGQPLGKILHLTLDGKPASNNPGWGQVGPFLTVVTDPPATPKRPSRRPGAIIDGRRTI